MRLINDKINSIQSLLTVVSTTIDENNKDIEYRLSDLESKNIQLADAFDGIAKILRGNYDGKNI